MSKKAALCAGLLALLVVVPQARAAAKEWSINFNGGIAAPVSDFKDAAKLGFMGGVGASYTVTENWALGVDGSFTSNSGSDLTNASLSLAAGVPATAKFSIMQGGVHAKYMFPMASESAMAPYFIGGLGFYNTKGSVESSDTAFNAAVEDASKATKFGARGGIGLMYKTSPKVSIGVESAFHWINTDVTSTQFISVQAGVSVGLGTPAVN
jgi:opacity protein-like surface antigen